MERELLEEALKNIIEYCKSQSIELSNSAIDGRINSSLNEQEVILIIKEYAEKSEWMIKNNLTIGIPNVDNNRCWYDFSIESLNTLESNVFMPINIKITKIDGGAADNLNCKLGIFWALTGCLPSSVIIDNLHLSNGISWEQFFKFLDNKMAVNKDKDYYFLVINKDDTKDIFWSSLKSLRTISPNGNNLPFQCKWKENRERVNRSFIEARDFILTCFKTSIEKRETIGVSFRKYIEKYIGLKTDLVEEDKKNVEC